ILFQSSPAPKSRCHPQARMATTSRKRFNPHRPRRAGATHKPAWLRHPESVSILTGPEEPVPPHLGRGLDRASHVSILTGPEERVPRVERVKPPGLVAVSILTGPEEPVPPGGLFYIDTTATTFQSSPAPKSRCHIQTML